jgi:hypothetical protein
MLLRIFSLLLYTLNPFSCFICLILIIEFGIGYFKVPLSQSEMHILILLDSICAKLNDYVRATRKSDNKLVIFNLMSPSGGMNPIMSEVDIIQDGDLNKSLEHYVSVICYVFIFTDVFSFINLG